MFKLEINVGDYASQMYVDAMAMSLVAGFLCCLLACHKIQKKTQV